MVGATPRPAVRHDHRRPDVLAEWLASYRVTRVGMESTGCYWKPVWHLLEDRVECWLLNAAHMHNVPGRNPDDTDAAWIAQLVEHGRPASCATTPRSGWQKRTV
jgi:transposase